MASAVSGGESQSLTGDSLEKSVDALRELLVPELAEDLEKKTEEVKRKMAAEHNRGPLYVRAPQQPKKGRIVRRRKS